MPRPRRHDIPPNPEEITLNTPPASPILPNLDLASDDHSKKNPTSSSNFTPQKKWKTGYTRSTTSKYFIQSPISDSPSFLDSNVPSSPSWEPNTTLPDISSSRIMDSNQQLADDFYYQFVEAVLVNAMPFYSITRDVYVTQGWDTKSGQSTVCYEYFLI